MAGVHDSEVLTLEGGGVGCHFSVWSERNYDDAQQDAVAFWSVVNRLFQQGTVIPFRYPTFLADEAALQEFMSLNGRMFLNELERLRGLVQVKITIQPENGSNAEPPKSGTEFLKQRQQLARSAADSAATIIAAGNGIVQEWKQAQKPDSTLLFGLLERDAFAEFNSRVAQTEYPAAVRFSGPWPPSEFVKCDLEMPAQTG